MLGNFFKYDKTIKGHFLDVENAKEPNDIIYKNLGISSMTIMSRKI